ncbi:MAG: glycoside hydrolase family 15 protein, partial [Acidimicrobiia bacterium]
MAYKPIENYGVVGNMHTVALVGMDGSVDWFCFPHFDSPSVFAAILDDQKGGRFRIAPTDGEVSHKQLYWPDTNVLLTRFLSPDGVGQVIDYMPAGVASDDPRRHWLVRQAQVVKGTMAFRLDCRPAFNYGRDEHEITATAEGACFYAPGLSLGLATEVPLKPNSQGVVAEFTLREGETAAFVLRQIEPGGGCGVGLSELEAEELFRSTVGYWRRWLSNNTYTGRWREMVHRSALVLRLLTYEPTGAIVAAPTSSLPEEVGGERNWDYRYTWIRDAAFTLYGLLRIGLTESAARFMDWLEARSTEPNPDGSLQIMYGLDGSHSLTEEVLDHFEGYKGSRPVRIGNAAYNQLQLDIYGELLDSVYLYNKYGTPISYDLWAGLRRLIDWVCDNWER